MKFKAIEALLNELEIDQDVTLKRFVELLSEKKISVAEFFLAVKFLESEVRAIRRSHELSMAVAIKKSLLRAEVG